MADKNGKRTTLTLKLNTLIVAIVLILAGGLILLAYNINSRQVDGFYEDTTSRAAATVAAFMDGDLIGRLDEALRSDDFRQVREQAVEAQNEEIIRDWMREQGLYEGFVKAWQELEMYRQKLGARFIYLQSVKGNTSVNLIDPNEDLLYVGSIEISAEEFSEYHSNVHIDPTVSTTEFGWLCSAYEPIIASDGTAVALAGVDIDMNDVMAARRRFLIDVLIFSGVLCLLSTVACMFLMRKVATRPLSMLSKATIGFADSETGYTKDDVIRLPIRSRDEIGDLYHEIRSMQGRMVDYLDNLTRVTKEKERIGAELNIATQIQADMLPRIFPPFPDRSEFDLFASMDPAKEVGGDFYDFFLVDEDHLALVIADVSGKGVPAALFMVIAKTLIKNRAMLGESPAVVLNNVNTQLCEGNEAELFVTVWLAILEISTGKGVAANAGHEHPVIRRAGGQYELAEYRHGPPVAVMEGIRFREHPFELNPGDSLLVYTDGVPEACDRNNVQFGTDRMLAALNRNPDAPPEEQVHTLRGEINHFAGDAEQFDDITILCLHYDGPDQNAVRRLEIRAETGNLEQVLAFVDEPLKKADCPASVKKQIEMAVEELFQNIASYAYGPEGGDARIAIRVEDGDPAEAVIEFRDNGKEFDPLKKPDPDLTLPVSERPIGGLGIYMVKKKMDGVAYRREGGENILTIRKKLADPRKKQA